MSTIKTQPPLIVHIIFRLDFGGLENGLVNLINNMPENKYRHAIICASDFTDFRKRIKKSDVEVYALNKKPGNDIKANIRLWKLLKTLKPDIVHTRNLGTIEYVIPAMLAGVKHRIHGEHGRDMSDIDGTNKKYHLLRRFYNIFLHRFVALSKDLEQWLLNIVEINPKKVVQLYNGVDLSRFKQINQQNKIRTEFPIIKVDDILIGTVGRLQAEKNQTTLINAFSLVFEKFRNIKLVLIGDGPDRQSLESLVHDKGLTEHVIFTGARNDIPELLAELDIFVLPSKGEGISNTILEAMASGLPVVATNVGGNPELVERNVTGQLVSSGDASEMAKAIEGYLLDRAMIKLHGKAGRQRVEALFSMDKMVQSYVDVYDSLIFRGET